MTYDSEKELLELEYADGLGNSLNRLSTSADIMRTIYEKRQDEWIYQGRDEYKAFCDYYDYLRKGFDDVTSAVKLAEGRNSEHTPNFRLLKMCMRQIDLSVNSISQFFEQTGNSSENFRDRFRPYAGYLDIITGTIDRVHVLARIYSNIVDTNMLAERYCTKRKN